ncbi:MAG TPA: DUF4410 domain-containing protein [Candidatus Acidoferrum sp.]|nr:DUF4410 domain-containing protein [Candidatus Acidoferrum sp.]
MPFAGLRSSGLRIALLLLLAIVFQAAANLEPEKASAQSSDGPTVSVPVLVSDFELFSIPPPADSPISSASEDASLPSVQARRLMDSFAATLVETLKKSGFAVRRAKGASQSKGALLRGVFAEPDEKNRIRRTLLGGTSANPKFFLYVGIFNLARPDQSLYQLAQEQPGGNQFGPVITLSSYIPLAKYELSKNPSDEDVRRVCGQIAASLKALLAANPNAFAQ